MSTPTATPTPTNVSARWKYLDALRGIAIAGILFVNIPDLTRLGYDLSLDERRPSIAGQVLHFTVQTRFVPIFTFLFGMSLVFVVRSARARGRRAWLAVLCRLVVLFGIGWLHGLLYTGEVLLEFAVFGLLVAPVILFIPRLVQLVLGAALTVAAIAFLGGGSLTSPGLMLLGAAAASYGLPQLLNHADRRIGYAFAAAALLSIPAVWWQTTQQGDPRFSTAGQVAGLVMAAGYVTATSLLWSTNVRPVIAAVFEPIGRMAMSNYVGASLVIYPVGRWLDFPHAPTPAPAILLAVCLIAMQSVVSRVWLSRFRYGPLEWLWRMATWRQLVRLRR